FCTTIFCFQTLPAAAGSCQLGLGLSDLLLDFFFVDLLRLTWCMTRIVPAIAAAMTSLTGTGRTTTCVALQRWALMTRLARIAGLLTSACLTALLTIPAGMLSRSSA